MSIHIVADSCCDQNTECPVATAPLTVQVGEQSFADDASLNVDQMLAAMEAYKDCPKSACPAPADFEALCSLEEPNVIVTLSSRLSGSYQSAQMAKKQVEEKGGRVHVLDSKSASAGEILLTLRLKEWAKEHLPFDEIVRRGEAFAARMNTFFVLENLDTLIKNGRMSKIKGFFAASLRILPILGANDGQIAFFDKARGSGAAMEKLARTIEKFAGLEGHDTLVITHCDNLPQVNVLKQLLAGSRAFQKIVVAQTGGLSSMYANRGGVIVAF